MAKKMLIDATHEEEVRLSVVTGNKLEEFDFETSSKQHIKGNVYLAQVTRVEPSLQAAFVEYGGKRQGFLPFSEIHPDYYQIPIADREVEEQTVDYDDDDVESIDEDAEVSRFDDESEELEVRSRKKRPRLKRHYKIQEVIKNRQVVLVQAVKEERGNKGSAMTTYLSLAGRYCVLMPNSSRGGGVSRKITDGQDRKRLKNILRELDEGKSGGVIVRTAGAERTKTEIKRDYKYIYSLWDKIRDKTLKSIAPELIYKEASLINRAIRDIYNNTVEEIIVAGENGYKIAKDYMKELTPSHAKKVQKYKAEDGIPLFQRYQVESQISHIYDSKVHLPSGGSIVLHQTEALVAIDVNSGRSIGERNVDATAIKTNLEAAAEVARQLRLRDMAGLIVIDFIDMENRKSNILVERKLKESLNIDRARIQVGRISQFGLLEMSRQRLRPSLIDASSSSCPSCGGSGMIPNLEISAMATLRSIEEEVFRKRSVVIRVTVPTNVGFYLLNNKRLNLSTLEENFDVRIVLQVSDAFVAPKYEIIRIDAEGNEVIVGAASENNKGSRGKLRKKTHNAERNKSHRNNRHNTGKNKGDATKQAAIDGNDTTENITIDDTPKTDKQKTDKQKSQNNKSRRFHGKQDMPISDMGKSDVLPLPTDKNSTDPTNEKPIELSDESSTKNLSSDMKQSVAKKTKTKKATAKKGASKKSTAKKVTTKKTTAKKTTAKKSIVKKSVAKKSTIKKATVKKAAVAQKADTPSATERKGWWS